MSARQADDREDQAPIEPGMKTDQPPRQVARPGTLLDRSGERIIAPEPSMMIRALRQIGYNFEQAIADLVDNSVSADAENVLIRFIARNERIRSIAIADDGTGMSASRLDEAMRFGSETDVSRRTLGKYGMGM